MHIKVDWYPWISTIDLALPLPRIVCMVQMDERELEFQNFFAVISQSWKDVVEQIGEFYRRAFGDTLDWTSDRIDGAVEEIGRAIDPFRLPLYPQLGFPVRMAVGDRYPHLIDELAEFAIGDQLEVRVERRPDLSDKTRLLSNVGDMVWNALGLRPHVNNVAWMVILTILDAIADDRQVKEWMRTKDFVADRTLARMQQEFIARGEVHKIGEQDGEVTQDAQIAVEMRTRLLSKAQPELLKILGHNLLLPILARDEIKAYQEFYTTYGRERVRGALVQVSYPSKLWQWLEQRGDSEMLLEIGATLTRYRLIQHRLQETKQSGLEASDSTTLQGLDLLYPDVLVAEFLTKELMALRLRLIEILSYPETFLKIRLNKDDLLYSRMLEDKLRVSYLPTLSKTQFMNTLSNWLKTTTPRGGSKTNPNIVLDAYFNTKYGMRCINLGEAMIGLFDVGDFGQFPPDVNALMGVHSRLVAANATLKDILAFTFNYLRNTLVHGRDFQVRSHDDWTKAVLCFRSRGQQYEAGYDSLATCYHLLPIVLLRLTDVT